MNGWGVLRHHCREDRGCFTVVFGGDSEAFSRSIFYGTILDCLDGSFLSLLYAFTDLLAGVLDLAIDSF